MDIKQLMSERAQENDKFNSVIIEPTQEVFDSVHRLIEVFPNLASIDYAPTQFIHLLADLFGYTYLEAEDDEVQREILKRLVDEYHRKGLMSTMMKIANRAHDPNFLLGDLTYYNSKIEEGYCSITYPRERLFRYDYSKWDGGHRWPDMHEWRDGVIHIDMSNPNDRTYEYIDKFLTAGVKFYSSTLKDFGGPDFVDMIYKALNNETDSWVLTDPDPLPPYVGGDKYFRWDYSKWDYSLLDSRYVISTDLWEEKKPQAAIHNIFFPIDFGYQVAEVYGEPFIWNWNRFCGVIGGYMEPDQIDIELGNLDYIMRSDDSYDDTIINDSIQTRAYAKLKEDVLLDGVALDNAKWDSHITISVEVFEETKPKVRLKYDQNRHDMTAFDGDDTSSTFRIEEKQIGLVDMTNKATSDLIDEGAITHIPAVYVPLIYFGYDIGRYDETEIDKMSERVVVEILQKSDD